MKAKLVDVFAESKLTGNGLTIFWDYPHLSTEEMQVLTQEMRQFESIFVRKTPEANSVKAKIFTMEEELDFAGHPLIGLAAHLHEEYGSRERHEWNIELRSGNVRLISHAKGDYYSASMELGAPEFISILKPSESLGVLSALNLDEENAADMPPEVISTGLPYLIVPVISGIEQARIKTRDFESLLNRYGAKFVYVLNVNTFEGRTWDNEGKVEDIATGSAAGPAAAFLFKAGLVSPDTPFRISQGRMVGRPSKIDVYLKANKNETNNIIVSGDVHKVASISFE
ncbi:MAG: PhzF family phenazine biosynthesis protein [Desulfobacteraceae bacterium]|nr:PhzF family phenazine biosynthesis protein [Desulfobacteraceae bacterium]